MQKESSSIFISDLHLCETRPNVTECFCSFLENVAYKSSDFYILGDLFDYWIGDEELDRPLPKLVVKGLNSLSNNGINIFFLPGNRDFLIGEKFAHASRLQRIDDFSFANLFGNNYLLMHGDTLCTDDTEYLKFRAKVRSKYWQKEFLSKPILERKRFAEKARNQSEKEKSLKSLAIMDVNRQAVLDVFLKYNSPTIIHGHTHRPAHHTYQVKGKTCHRFVLPDWDQGGGYIKCDSTGCSLHML